MQSRVLDQSSRPRADPTSPSGSPVRLWLCWTRSRASQPCGSSCPWHPEARVSGTGDLYTEHNPGRAWTAGWTGAAPSRLAPGPRARQGEARKPLNLRSSGQGGKGLHRQPGNWWVFVPTLITPARPSWVHRPSASPGPRPQARMPDAFSLQAFCAVSTFRCSSLSVPWPQNATWARPRDAAHGSPRTAPPRLLPRPPEARRPLEVHHQGLPARLLQGRTRDIEFWVTFSRGADTALGLPGQITQEPRSPAPGGLLCARPPGTARVPPHVRGPPPGTDAPVQAPGQRTRPEGRPPARVRLLRPGDLTVLSSGARGPCKCWPRPPSSR